MGSQPRRRARDRATAQEPRSVWVRVLASSASCRQSRRTWVRLVAVEDGAAYEQVDLPFVPVAGGEFLSGGPQRLQLRRPLGTSSRMASHVRHHCLQLLLKSDCSGEVPAQLQPPRRLLIASETLPLQAQY